MSMRTCLTRTRYVRLYLDASELDYLVTLQVSYMSVEEMGMEGDTN